MLPAILASLVLAQAVPSVPLGRPVPVEEKRAREEIRAAVDASKALSGKIIVTGDIPTDRICSMTATNLAFGGSKSFIDHRNMVNYIATRNGRSWSYRIQGDHKNRGGAMQCFYQKHPNAPPLAHREWGDHPPSCDDYDDAFWTVFRAQCVKP